MILNLLMMTILLIELSITNYSFIKINQKSKLVNTFKLYSIINIIILVSYFLLFYPQISGQNMIILSNVIFFIWSITQGIYLVLIYKAKNKKLLKKEPFSLLYLSILMFIFILLIFLIPKNYSQRLFFITLIPLINFINIILIFLVLKKAFLAIDYEAFSKELFTNVYDGVILIDKYNKIILINNLAYKMISSDFKKELINTRVTEIFESYNSQFDYKDFRIRIKNSKKEFLISKSIMNSKKSTFKSLIILKDLSYEKKLQDELIKKQKLESISSFVGGIAHDFSNILTAILGNTTYIKMKIENNEEVNNMLQDTEKIILRAKNLTNKLFEYSNIEHSKEKKSLSIDSIINASVSLSLTGSDISVSITKEGSYYVDGNKEQLSQLFSTLLINSKQAINGPGSVDINITKIEIEKQYTQFIKPGSYVQVSIKDTGTGISKNKLHQIFKPYFTTKASSGGLGLGLAIASSIIENHNGYINVESELNKGSIFNIYIPSIEKFQKVSTITSQNPLINTNKKEKVLLMDDEEMILKVTGKLLEALNYEVIAIKTGTEVLDYLDTNTEHNISIYILDLTIPGNIGGKELAPRIKERYPDSKVIVSTGYATKDESINFNDYKFDSRLTKPYTMEDLRKVLRELKNVQ